MKSTLFAIATLAVAALAPSAYADSTFTATPGVLGGPTGTFDANKISGSGSTLLTLDYGTKTVAGKGYVQFNTFSLNGIDYFGSETGLNNSPGYQLYTTFDYMTKLSSGIFGMGGSEYDITSLNFSVFGTKLLDGRTTYTQASVDPTVTPTVKPAGTTTANPDGVKYLIGTGTLATSGKQTASFNTAGGTSFTSTSMFTLSDFGKTFLTGPSPFYSNVSNSFTNISDGFTESADGKTIALNKANGGVDFSAVPEPSSIALLGLGLLALGVTTARRRKS